jgi:hypothetical protein
MMLGSSVFADFNLRDYKMKLTQARHNIEKKRKWNLIQEGALHGLQCAASSFMSRIS